MIRFAALKRLAFNLKHQLKARRAQRSHVALRSAKSCVSGFWRNALICAFASILSSSAFADEAKPERGSVTNLPLPRFVSLKTSESNVRRGPSLSHRIDWVYQRKNLPVEITAEYGHWRRVRDRDGVGGWVHYSLLSGARYVMIEEDMLGLHLRPDPDTQITARLELGVIARLGDCTLDWCKLNAGGYKGWAPKAALWGVRADEIRE